LGLRAKIPARDFFGERQGLAARPAIIRLPLSVFFYSIHAADFYWLAR
jgi:hypothetical protein